MFTTIHKFTQEKGKACMVKVVMPGSANDGPDWDPHIRSKTSAESACSWAFLPLDDRNAIAPFGHQRAKSVRSPRSTKTRRLKAVLHRLQRGTAGEAIHPGLLIRGCETLMAAMRGRRD